MKESTSVGAHVTQYHRLIDSLPNFWLNRTVQGKRRQTDTVATWGESAIEAVRKGSREGGLLNIGEDFKSFDDVLADLSLRSAQNQGSVRGAAIERYRGAPNESRNAASPQHTLVMGSSFPARFEIAVGHHNSVSYVRAPGALSLEPAGVVPVMSARSDFELIVCVLDVSLVKEVEAALDRRPEGELRLRTNFEDAATQQLMK